MMIKLLIRILSFVICIGLLVGGAILSFNETKKNDELSADFDDIMQTPWIAGVGQNADGE